jgi:MSHA pilin protein MshA
MKNFNKQKGFTLIELVVVIVILGILAVTAAPKFIDLTGDARGSVVTAVEGSMNSVADMVHAKALVQGKLAEENDKVMVNSTEYAVVFGWPTVGTIGSFLELGKVMEPLTNHTGSFNHKEATNKATCVAVYVNAANATSRPNITSVVTGC